MSNVYIEQEKPKQYDVIQNKEVIATARTQKKAIEKAHFLRPHDPVLAERVRDTAKGKRDRWRSV